MAYTQTVWQDGDLITAEKLNNMEAGIGSAGGALIINDNDGTLDKTWQEIWDAAEAGKTIILRIVSVSSDSGGGEK